MQKINSSHDELTIKLQIEELDNAIEECIKRLKNEKSGTGMRVFIAEYEELMFLRTKLLTQMVIAEQQERHICKRFEYQPEPKRGDSEISSLKDFRTEKSAGINSMTAEYIDCGWRKADRNSKIALRITVVTFILIILAYLDKIVFFVSYVLSYRR